jgi:mono/diheme cytochrome c family protein
MNFNSRMVRVTRSLMLFGSTAFVIGAALAPDSGQAAQTQTPTGWQLPADAQEKKNPHPVDDKLLATGLAVYKDKCARCHGPGGLGDGPDADPDTREDMDLTNPGRADHNPDGVVFYKVWTGRRRPKMPAFSAELTEEQAWAVVAYVQSLRKK